MESRPLPLHALARPVFPFLTLRGHTFRAVSQHTGGYGTTDAMAIGLYDFMAHLFTPPPVNHISYRLTLHYPGILSSVITMLAGPRTSCLPFGSNNAITFHRYDI